MVWGFVLLDDRGLVKFDSLVMISDGCQSSAATLSSSRILVSGSATLIVIIATAGMDQVDTAGVGFWPCLTLIRIKMDKSLKICFSRPPSSTNHPQQPLKVSRILNFEFWLWKPRSNLSCFSCSSPDLVMVQCAADVVKFSCCCCCCCCCWCCQDIMTLLKRNPQTSSAPAQLLVSE